MLPTEHELYMQRCLQLAQYGAGRTAPNPMVGSVIVHNGLIIGEGYHRQYGGPHAEVNAIASVKDSSLLGQSTLYVNLEPCAHFGKTPPCADLIIEKRIPRVVIGCRDPFPLVDGKGIEKLQKAGVEVLVDVLKEESRALNRRFFTFHEQQRPYIILKWAQTLDGFIDKTRKANDPVQPSWITNEQCRRLVHKWRTQEAGILVGTHTALNDNPRLNVRDWSGIPPMRMVIDRLLRLPSHLHLFDCSQPTVVFTEQEPIDHTSIQYVQLPFDCSLSESIVRWCFQNRVQSIIIEGGSQTLHSFIDAGLWDEARVFYGSIRFVDGVKAPGMTATEAETQQIGNSMLKYFYND